MKSKLFSRWKNLLPLLLVALLFSGAVESKAASPAEKIIAETIAGFESDEKRIFDLVNEERAKSGLSRLIWNSGLARMGRSYSQQMADENFFSHYDSRGASVVDRAQAARIEDWSKIGENLFYFEGNRNFNQLAVKSWMKSPAHRRNILDADWTTSGIGVAQSKNGRIYITQIFIER